MDNLNKHQVILLALLVCFVTSIATGITVVSLMGQTPQPVAQTINRVVEKTIERVVSPTTSGNTNTPTAQEKTTVVVKEEDLTVDAIDKNSKSLVKITGTVGTTPDTFLTDGIVVSDKGFVIADRTALLQSTTFTGILSDGTKISLEAIAQDEKVGLTLLRAKISADQKVTFTAPTWADSKNLKLGQTIISLSNDAKIVVNIGNITSLEGGLTPSDDIKNIVPGGILFNLSGDIAAVRFGSTFVLGDSTKTSFTALLPK